MNTESSTSRGSIQGNLLGIGFFLVLVIALIGIFISVFSPYGHRSSSRACCLNNLKQLGTAMNMYQNDWDDCMPLLRTTRQRARAGESWWDRLCPYVKNKKIIACPEPYKRPTSNDRLCYSFNPLLSGMPESRIRKPKEVAVMWCTVSDSPLNTNINSARVWRPGTKHLPRVGDYVAWPAEAGYLYRKWPKWARPRHDGDNNVCYADGHAAILHPGQTPRFSPK